MPTHKLIEKNTGKSYEDLDANEDAIIPLTRKEMDENIEAIRELEQSQLTQLALEAWGNQFQENIDEQLSGLAPLEGASFTNPQTSTPLATAQQFEVVNAMWVRQRLQELVLSASTYEAVQLPFQLFGGTQHWVKWEWKLDAPIARYTVTSNDATHTQGTVIDIHGLLSGQAGLLVIKRGPTAANASATVKLEGCNLMKGFSIEPVANAETLVSITRIGNTYYAESRPLSGTIQQRLAKVENLRVTAQTTTSVTLGWEPSAGAGKYKMSMSTNATWQGLGGTQGDVTTPSYTRSGLTPGGTYYFSVQAQSPTLFNSEYVILKVVMPT